VFNPVTCPADAVRGKFVVVGSAEIPEHCLNGVWDERTEEGIDCGGQCSNACRYVKDSTVSIPLDTLLKKADKKEDAEAEKKGKKEVKKKAKKEAKKEAAKKV
jgi:hypothetical protein